MRPLALLLIPAFVLACNKSPSGGTGSDTDTDTSTGASTSGSSATSSNTGANCIPGQSVVCTCIDGDMGAQVCNASGTAFDECLCTGGGSSPTSTTTTTTTTTGATTVEMTTTSGDVTATGSTGGGGSTGGMASSSGGSSGGGGGDTFGPCPNGTDAECQPNEICINGQNMQGPWSICTTGTCQGNGDCDSNVCADAPGDGQFQAYCLLQTCSNMNPCPMGMACIAGFGMGNPSVCLWQ